MSLSLVIASVPIALPMVMKVTLAVGAKEMAKEGGIVTHLTALEEIASMVVLCSDKTGTLTTASMTVYHETAVRWMGPTPSPVQASRSRLVPSGQPVVSCSLRAARLEPCTIAESVQWVYGRAGAQAGRPRLQPCQQGRCHRPVGVPSLRQDDGHGRRRGRRGPVQAVRGRHSWRVGIPTRE